MNRRLLFASLLAVALVSLSARALADALPPDEVDCDVGRNPVGAACSMYDQANTKGTCQPSTCQRKTSTDCGDAGTSLTDGGTPTCMKPVACNVCVPNGAKSGGCAAAPSGVDASSLLLPLGLAALVPLALRRRRPRR